MVLIGVSIWASILNFFIIALALILILVVLIQRGKGGGLAGAFGGSGGSSAFGSRTGDAFTKITISIAAIWVLLIMIQVWVVKADNKNPGARFTSMIAPQPADRALAAAPGVRATDRSPA